MPRNRIDLSARTPFAWVKRAAAVLVGWGLAAVLLIAPFSDSDWPIWLRVVVGAIGIPFALLALAGTQLLFTGSQPGTLACDSLGLRILDRNGRVIVRLGWSELAGVGVMTNEVARARARVDNRRDPVGRAIAAKPIWLELHPVGAEVVARHPELAKAWKLGEFPRREPQRWLVGLGDENGRNFRVGELVQRWRPDLWRGHRSASLVFGEHSAERVQSWRRLADRWGGPAR